MPIFTNRAIANMVKALCSVFGPRMAAVKARLASPAHAIATEWEIAVAYCLSRRGAIELSPEVSGVGNVDLIYTASDGTRILVEVTALSDAYVDELNPVEPFWEELRKASKGLPGALAARIGHGEREGRILLGIPSRAEMPGFFKSAEFVAFLRGIRAATDQRHRFDFHCRGIASVIYYAPEQSGGGGHAAYDVILDLERNVFTKRLKAKDSQIKRSAQQLPGMVILCDGDCRALQHNVRTPGRPSVDEIITGFLNGRPRHEAGPWLLQQGMASQSRRINAVGILATREKRELATADYHRIVEGRYILNDSMVYHPVPEAVVREVMESFTALPRPSQMPYNAKRPWKLPALYGWFSLKGTTMNFSLLTLQKLLTGELSYEKFVADHRYIVNAVRQMDAEGRMISSAAVIHRPEEDDDIIQLEFNRPNPQEFFKGT